MTMLKTIQKAILEFEKENPGVLIVKRTIHEKVSEEYRKAGKEFVLSTFDNQYRDCKLENEDKFSSPHTKFTAKFDANLTDLGYLEKNEEKLKKYLERTLDIPRFFTGPSLYFHEEAIREARKGEFLGEPHLKMIYAVLPAWGMHRMGDTKAKIVGWEKFNEQILGDGRKGELTELRNKIALCEVEKVFEKVEISEIVNWIFKIRVSESCSRLVSSSKTLHHILPELFPPIDRAYSIRFMKQRIEKEGEKLFDKKQCDSFSFKPTDDEPTKLEKSHKHEEPLAIEFITRMIKFIKIHGPTMKDYLYNPNDAKKKEYRFNTSLPKIFDNLIVAFIRDKREDKSPSDNNDSGDNDDVQ